MRAQAISFMVGVIIVMLIIIFFGRCSSEMPSPTGPKLTNPVLFYESRAGEKIFMDSPAASLIWVENSDGHIIAIARH